MSGNTAIAIYTLLAIALIVLIFLGALVFVDAVRKGNRAFKWGGRLGRPRDQD